MVQETATATRSAPVDVERTSRARLPTDAGDLELVGFRWSDGTEHAAVVQGDLQGRDEVLARVHSRCLTGDVLGSLRCDCGSQLDHALQRIADADRGVLLYLDQEGRGIGLHEKIRAYRLQDEGADTVEANHELGHPTDARTYEDAATMLRMLGVEGVRLLTNNPDKVRALDAHGLPVRERVPLQVGRREENADYLDTKRDLMGHLLDA